jgi:hypothetical protein
MSWYEAIKVVDRIADIYDGGVYDREAGRFWDAGQAICREAWGAKWYEDPDWRIANNAETAPPLFFKAAERLIKATPAWARDPEEPSP